MKTTRERLFPKALSFLVLIEQIVPTALRHRYSFVSDEGFRAAQNSGSLSLAETNHLIVLDNLEKSHLAALAALIRTKRWTDAVCIMFDAENFLGFASSMRGLLESSGDIVDGLINVPMTLALNRHDIALALAGKQENEFISWSAFEDQLDHFVHAGWTRKSSADSALKARPNVDYVKTLDCEVPNVVSLYHRLCAITHPSNASINWLYEFNPEDRLTRISTESDAASIATLCAEFPEALDGAVMMACNPSLLILRVLHKFNLHPKLEELKQYGFGTSKLGRDLERLLR